MKKGRINQNKKAALLLGGLFLLLLVLGLFVFFYDKAPWLSPLHQSKLAGPLEIVIILAGLGLASLFSVFSLVGMWKGQQKSFLYDVGLRLVITGYLVSFFSAMADYFGIGAHHLLPYFGPLQAAGVYLGEAVIMVGFLMMFPHNLQN